MNFFDPGFIAAAQNIQAPDYLGSFYRAFQLADTLPWSARRQRENAIQDWQLGMEQARFDAEMMDRARQSQIQELMLPYQIQRAQRLASGTPYTSNNLGDGMYETGGFDFSDLPPPPMPGAQMAIPTVDATIPALTPPENTGVAFEEEIPLTFGLP